MLLIDRLIGIVHPQRQVVDVLPSRLQSGKMLLSGGIKWNKRSMRDAMWSAGPCSSSSSRICTAPLYLSLSAFMGKLLAFTAPPAPGDKRRERTSDPRYVNGERLLVKAMRYLAQADPVKNRLAIELISELVRTRFRETDRASRSHHA